MNSLFPENDDDQQQSAMAEAPQEESPVADPWRDADEENTREETFTIHRPVEYTPPTTAETIRNTGLAWSAGIVFFASIVFMLFLGWIADLLFGSSPWGLLGGIVLGSIIGFVQFFRVTSQIFRK